MRLLAGGGAPPPPKPPLFLSIPPAIAKGGKPLCYTRVRARRPGPGTCGLKTWSLLRPPNDLKNASRCEYSHPARRSQAKAPVSAERRSSLRINFGTRSPPRSRQESNHRGSCVQSHQAPKTPSGAQNTRQPPARRQKHPPDGKQPQAPKTPTRHQKHREGKNRHPKHPPDPQNTETIPKSTPVHRNTETGAKNTLPKKKSSRCVLQRGKKQALKANSPRTYCLFVGSRYPKGSPYKLTEGIETNHSFVERSPFVRGALFGGPMEVIATLSWVKPDAHPCPRLPGYLLNVLRIYTTAGELQCFGVPLEWSTQKVKAQ